ncbi:MAG: FCD domain-containing protein [Pseudomonadota bacterium]
MNIAPNSQLLRGPDAISELRQLISEGGYGPGDRLPPERELISRLGIGRSALRRALEQLEQDGQIWRHVGKGTFIASPPGSTPPDQLKELVQRLTPVRMIRARQAIEPAIAREAAINVSPEALSRIRDAMEGCESAASWDDYEIADDRFHRAVAEASDNLLLLALFDQLNQARRAVAWKSVVRDSEKPRRDHKSFKEHAAVTAAIETHDANGAQDAMRRHIASVSARLFAEG